MSQSQIMCVLPVNVLTPTKYCCGLQNQLKKDLAQLQKESQRIQVLEVQCNEKLELFLEVSRAVDYKLCYLWSLGDQICTTDYPKSLQVYGFANRMSEAWRDGDDVIAQDVQAVQIASSTVSNAPLDFVIENAKSNLKEAWESFQKVSFHMNCIGQFTELRNKIGNLILRLQDGNQTLRYFLSICKAIPYLKDLETVIDKYTQNISQYMLSQSSSVKNDKNYEEEKSIRCQEDLSAFTNVVKLLTGELLNEEDYLDHHSEIEPIVGHEIPEIPKPAYINPFPPTPSYRNAIQNWNYDKMSSNESPFIDGIYYPGAETGAYNYPVILQQPPNFSHIIPETAMISQNSSSAQVNLGVRSMIDNVRLDPQQNNVGLIQKIIPEPISHIGIDKYVNENNVVSVLLLEHNKEAIINNNLHGRRSVENVIRIIESGKSNTKDVTFTKRRRITRRVRTSTTFNPEANDLQPIKIPSLKQNLLTPLVED